jgi:ADP-dependent NAD(P)H-hydrate dehydratase / NAD(P)H-hydrate epimerase
MKPDYWSRQTTDKPLFPDLLWSRPENKAYAGKLLIVGGNEFGFVAPANAYSYAEAAGIGVIRMLLPESMRKYVGKTFDAGDFAPATPSGSFSQRALAEMLDMARWADGVLLAGNFGKNSETAILLEKFAAKCPCALMLAGDAVDHFLAAPTPVLDRERTTLALDFSQLQKLAVGAHHPKAFTSQLDFLHFIDMLHGFADEHKAHLLVSRLGQTFVASQGQVSITPNPDDNELLKAASQTTVWWLQNPDKAFQAMTTALVV